MTITAREALERAIDAAVRADRLDTNNPAIPSLALLAQAWAAIAHELGAWDTLYHDEGGDGGDQEDDISDWDRARYETWRQEHDG